MPLESFSFHMMLYSFGLWLRKAFVSDRITWFLIRSKLHLCRKCCLAISGVNLKKKITSVGTALPLNTVDAYKWEFSKRQVLQTVESESIDFHSETVEEALLILDPESYNWLFILKEADFICIFWCIFVLYLCIKPIKTETIFQSSEGCESIWWIHSVPAHLGENANSL